MLSKKHLIKLFFVALFIIHSIVTYSQTEWEEAGVLYSKNEFQIKLLYKLKSDSCEPNSMKKSHYEYDIIGTYSERERYLNWRMDYLTCSGLIMTQVNSLKIGTHEKGLIVNPEYTFSGFKVVKPFYDVKISSMPDNTPVLLKGGLKSVPPINIIHEDQVFKGDVTNLKIQGGQLGYGAEWIWYKDNLNSIPVGKGEQITVFPQNSSTYYVRAEGQNDISKSVGAFIKISENSIIGEKIEGESMICKGQQQKIQLQILGGRLGKKSEWKWYKDDCGGKSIGSGRIIEIFPIGKATYFVRAEGPSETSVCLSKEITVTDLSKTPKEIVGNSSICWGETLNLSIKGGKLAIGANWVWYEQNLMGIKVIGNGETINVRPQNTTVYLVRAEGVCNNTEQISKNVTVNSGSTLPENIETNFGSSTLLSKGNYIFSLSGGNLTGDSKWVWYKTDIDNIIPVKIGEGNFVKMNFKKSSTLMVRAEGGNCHPENLFYKKEFALPEFQSNKSSSSQLGYNYLNFGLVSSSLTENSNLNPASTNNLVVTYARNGKEKISWYIKGKYCIKSKGQSDYQTTDDGVISSNNSQSSNSTPTFNGNVAEERYGATLGLLFGPKNLRFFLGYGWGKRELKWGISEFQYNSYSSQITTISTNKWASNTDRYYEGSEIEGGFILKLSIFNIQGGISTITPTLSSKGFKYFDTHFGIGFNF